MKQFSEIRKYEDYRVEYTGEFVEWQFPNGVTIWRNTKTRYISLSYRKPCGGDFIGDIGDRWEVSIRDTTEDDLINLLSLTQRFE